MDNLQVNKLKQLLQVGRVNFKQLQLSLNNTINSSRSTRNLKQISDKQLDQPSKLIKIQEFNAVDDKDELFNSIVDQSLVNKTEIQQQSRPRQYPPLMISQIQNKINLRRLPFTTRNLDMKNLKLESLPNYQNVGNTVNQYQSQQNINLQDQNRQNKQVSPLTNRCILSKLNPNQNQLESHNLLTGNEQSQEIFEIQEETEREYKNQQTYGNESIDDEMLTTFSSCYLEIINSNLDRVKAQTQRFYETNKNNPLLLMPSKRYRNLNLFPNFTILEDEPIQSSNLMKSKSQKQSDNPSQQSAAAVNRVNKNRKFIMLRNKLKCKHLQEENKRLFMESPNRFKDAKNLKVIDVDELVNKEMTQNIKGKYDQSPSLRAQRGKPGFHFQPQKIKKQQNQQDKQANMYKHTFERLFEDEQVERSSILPRFSKFLPNGLELKRLQETYIGDSSSDNSSQYSKSSQSSITSEMPREIKFQKQQRNKKRKQLKQLNLIKLKREYDQNININAKSTNNLIRSMTFKNDFLQSKNLQSKSQNRITNDTTSSGPQSSQQMTRISISQNKLASIIEDKRMSVNISSYFQPRKSSLIKILLEKHKISKEKMHRLKQQQQAQLTEKQKLQQKLERKIEKEHEYKQPIFLKIHQIASDDQSRQRIKEERMKDFKNRIKQFNNDQKNHQNNTFDLNQTQDVSGLQRFELKPKFKKNDDQNENNYESGKIKQVKVEIDLENMSTNFNQKEFEFLPVISKTPKYSNKQHKL